MKKGIIIAIVGAFSAILQTSYADYTTPPSISFSAIRSCATYEQELTGKTISHTIRDISSIGAKLARARKYVIVMKIRGARCIPPALVTPQSGQDINFFTFTNTGVLKSFTTEQKKEIATRVNIYKDSFFTAVDALIAGKFITIEDKALMKGKVIFQYVSNCSEFDGKISLKQWYNSNKVRVRNELIGFNINVNICFEPWFATDLPASVNQIMAHELGHYFYYFHDKIPKQFEAICRVPSINKPVCTRKNFVSDYAMSSPEEDYAETFAFWFLKKLYPGKDPQLQDKEKYFDAVVAGLQ